jgi:Zn-dependent protease
VNIHNLRSPKRDMLWVSFAGPGANLLMAVMWTLFGAILPLAGVAEPFTQGMASAGVLVNLAMAALNLFPLPPLDGGRMLASLLPLRQANMLLRIEPYGFFVVMALAFTPVLGLWMGPLMEGGWAILGMLASLF